MLALSLVVLLGCTFAVSAFADPGAPAAAPPLPTAESCAPSSPLPVCGQSTTAPQAPGVALPIPTGPTSTVPSSTCTGQDCLSPPPTSTPATGGAGTGQQGGSGDAECSIWSPSTWGVCVDSMLTSFFRTLVGSALNPLLDLLGHTLLTTPDPSSLPRIGELWNNSWEILLACYGLLVVIAGVLVMAYQSVQTRYSVKQLLPRLAVGFLAGGMSLVVATQAIAIANALAGAVMGTGVDVNSAADTLKNIYLIRLDGFSIFETLLDLAMAAGLVAVLLTYIVRVALTLILIAGAPIMLMGHALPQTDGIAKWWWKAFGGCLAVQVAQSLALITAIRVLLAPGFTPLGPTSTGLVNLLVGLALVYILVKIPFWILGSIRGGGGRSFLGGIARAYVMGKALGVLGVRMGGRRGGVAGGARGASARGARPSAPADPRWPVPLREWGGIDGIYSPEAVGRRLREHLARGQAARHPASRVGPVRFQQAAPQTPTHDLATGHASGRPDMNTFRSAVPDDPAASVSPPRPTAGPGVARFRAPGGPPRVPAPLPRIRTAQVPAALRFQPAVPPAPVRPVRASTPPTRPTFQSPAPDPGATGRRARSHTPAPVQFQAPHPPAPAAPPTPVSTGSAAPVRFHAPPTPPARPRPAPQPGGEQ
jgi:hypothetical protein